MERPLPEVSSGPNVQYREHSFFYNPRVPATVREDKLIVYTCKVRGRPSLCSPALIYSCFLLLALFVLFFVWL